MKVAVLRTRSYDVDLERVWLYHRDQQSLEAANRTLRQIEERVDLLGQFPEMGERIPQFGNQVRRIIVGRYLVFYEAWDDRVEVLRILHAAQDARSLES